MNGYLPNGQLLDPLWEDLQAPMYCDFLADEFRVQPGSATPPDTPEHCKTYFEKIDDDEGLKSPQDRSRQREKLKGAAGERSRSVDVAQALRAQAGAEATVGHRDAGPGRNGVHPGQLGIAKQLRQDAKDRHRPFGGKKQAMPSRVASNGKNPPPQGTSITSALATSNGADNTSARASSSGSVKSGPPAPATPAPSNRPASSGPRQPSQRPRFSPPASQAGDGSAPDPRNSLAARSEYLPFLASDAAAAAADVRSDSGRKKLETSEYAPATFSPGDSGDVLPPADHYGSAAADSNAHGFDDSGSQQLARGSAFLRSHANPKFLKAVDQAALSAVSHSLAPTNAPWVSYKTDGAAVSVSASQALSRLLSSTQSSPLQGASTEELLALVADRAANGSADSLGDPGTRDPSPSPRERIFSAAKYAPAGAEPAVNGGAHRGGDGDGRGRQRSEPPANGRFKATATSPAAPAGSVSSDSPASSSAGSPAPTHGKATRAKAASGDDTAFFGASGSANGRAGSAHSPSSHGTADVRSGAPGQRATGSFGANDVSAPPATAASQFPPARSLQSVPYRPPAHLFPVDHRTAHEPLGAALFSAPTHENLRSRDAAPGPHDNAHGRDVYLRSASGEFGSGSVRERGGWQPSPGVAAVPEDAPGWVELPMHGSASIRGDELLPASTTSALGDSTSSLSTPGGDYLTRELPRAERPGSAALAFHRRQVMAALAASDSALRPVGNPLHSAPSPALPAHEYGGRFGESEQVMSSEIGMQSYVTHDNPISLVSPDNSRGLYADSSALSANARDAPMPARPAAPQGEAPEAGSFAAAHGGHPQPSSMPSDLAELAVAPVKAVGNLPPSHMSLPTHLAAVGPDGGADRAASPRHMPSATPPSNPSSSLRMPSPERSPTYAWATRAAPPPQQSVSLAADYHSTRTPASQAAPPPPQQPPGAALSAPAAGKKSFAKIAFSLARKVFSPASRSKATPAERASVRARPSTAPPASQAYDGARTMPVFPAHASSRPSTLQSASSLGSRASPHLSPAQVMGDVHTLLDAAVPVSSAAAASAARFSVDQPPSAGNSEAASPSFAPTFKLDHIATGSGRSVWHSSTTDSTPTAFTAALQTAPFSFAPQTDPSFMSMPVEPVVPSPGARSHGIAVNPSVLMPRIWPEAPLELQSATFSAQLRSEPCDPSALALSSTHSVDAGMNVRRAALLSRLHERPSQSIALDDSQSLASSARSRRSALNAVPMRVIAARSNNVSALHSLPSRPQQQQQREQQPSAIPASPRAAPPAAGGLRYQREERPRSAAVGRSPTPERRARSPAPAAAAATRRDAAPAARMRSVTPPPTSRAAPAAAAAPSARTARTATVQPRSAAAARSPAPRSRSPAIGSMTPRETASAAKSRTSSAAAARLHTTPASEQHAAPSARTETLARSRGAERPAAAAAHVGADVTPLAERMKSLRLSGLAAEQCSIRTPPSTARGAPAPPSPRRQDSAGLGWSASTAGGRRRSDASTQASTQPEESPRYGARPSPRGDRTAAQLADRQQALRLRAALAAGKPTADERARSDAANKLMTTASTARDSDAGRAPIAGGAGGPPTLPTGAAASTTKPKPFMLMSDLRARGPRYKGRDAIEEEQMAHFQRRGPRAAGKPAAKQQHAEPAAHKQPPAPAEPAAPKQQPRAEPAKTSQRAAALAALFQPRAQPSARSPSRSAKRSLVDADPCALGRRGREAAPAHSSPRRTLRARRLHRSVGRSHPRNTLRSAQRPPLIRFSDQAAAAAAGGGGPQRMRRPAFQFHAALFSMTPKLRRPKAKRRERSTAVEPQPFRLATEQIGARKAARFTEQVQRELAAAAAAHNTRASGAPPPTLWRPDFEVTLPSHHPAYRPVLPDMPPHLRSAALHAKAQELLARKVAEERERLREQAEFRARKVQRVDVPFVPEPSAKPLTRAESPAFVVNARLEQRAAFDAGAAQRRVAREAEHEAEAASRQAEEEAEHLAWLKAHEFKARPMPGFYHTAGGQIPLQSKSLL